MKRRIDVDGCRDTGAFAPRSYGRAGTMRALFVVTNGWWLDVTQLCDPKTNTPGEPILITGRIHPIYKRPDAFIAPIATISACSSTIRKCRDQWCRCRQLAYHRRAPQLVWAKCCWIADIDGAFQRPKRPIYHWLMSIMVFSTTADLIRFSD